MRADLRNADTHFAFGENWARYAEQIDPAKVQEAVRSLQRLSGRNDLTGLRMLDIGCGSGLHSLAALELGAARVVAVDIDPNSVATTRTVLDRFAKGGDARVEQRSVFELSPDELGQFDVVYSWGVLHHTGDMVPALERAASLVKPGGVLLFALYRRTFLCGFWKVEKKWYASASPRAQGRAQRAYVAWFRLISWVARRRSADAYIDSYKGRGMDFHHDVHDWLGGYPYESILPADVDVLMTRLGLTHQASFLCRANPGRSHGLLGSGCDEYRYVR